MKRPLGLIGFFYFAALVFATRLGLNFAVAAGIFLLFAGGGSLFFRRFRTTGVFPAAFFSAGAACLMVALAWNMAVYPVWSLEKTEQPVRAVITSDGEDHGSYFTYTAQMTTRQEPEITFRARLSVDAPLECEAYDCADMTVKLYRIADEYAGSFFADGIYVTAYPVGEFSISPNEHKPWSYSLYCARRYASQQANEHLSPLLASVVTGVTLGDKVSIPDELYGQIKTAGVTHMFAVSGMHIAVFGQLLVMLLSALGVRRRRAPAYALAIVWLFIGVCGFPYSSIRAGIMFSIYAVGLALFEQADAINSLGVALLAIVLPNPFSAMDVGLLLSAAATLGIVLLAKPIAGFLERFLPQNRWVSRGLRVIYNVIAVSAAASLLTAPILILVFGQLAPYSILTNILLFLAPNVILFCTPLAVLFSLLHLDFLVSPLFLADGLAAKFMVFCVQKIAGLPFAFLPADESYLHLTLAGCLILIALWMLLAPGSRKLLRLTAIFCTVLIAVSVGSHTLLERGVTRVYLTEDEEGISALVLGDGHAALIGCGSEKNAGMRGLLSSKMIGELDAVVLPALDDTYAAGAGRILDRLEVHTLYAPENGVHRSQLDCRSQNFTLSTLPTEPVELWEGASIGLDEESGAVILRIGSGEIAFVVSSDAPAVSSSIAIAPEGLSRPVAPTLLLAGQNAAAAASLAAQGAAVYTAGEDGGLCIASRGDNFMIRRS